MPDFIPTPRRLLQTAAIAPAAPACFTSQPAGWQPTSWAGFAAQVQAAAGGLLALGLQPGGRVAILAYNRPEWVIADLAIMLAGGVSVGIYFSAAAAEIAFILQDSAATVLIAENPAQAAKLAGQAQTPAPPQVVLMDGAPGPGQRGWAEFLALGEARGTQARLDAITPESPATLLYTSGTTGLPKAVELSHAALCNCIGVMQQGFTLNPADRIISYLPLAHIAEKMLGIHLFAAVGFQLYFARSVQDLPAHLPQVRPTVFFGVPRVWEKMSAGLREAAAGHRRARLAAWAQRVSTAWHRTRRDGQAPGAALALQYHLARLLVFRRVKTALGLAEARLLISAAAPLAPEVMEFLSGFDLVVYEMYGLSETCGPATSNLPGAHRLGSVGRAPPGTEIRIAADGEILVRDSKLFTGYAGQPAATAETLVGGWLATGDLGRLDADGFLYITGRKKDIIITAGGKNIAPTPIEAALEAIPLVEHAVVLGDRKPHLTALLTLEPAQLAAFAAAHDLPPENLHRDAQVRAAIQHGIDALNAQSAPVAAIRKFALLPDRFTIEAGELTPTLKIKRAGVAARHRAVFEALYE
jgi:long-chain acyl-CoA synthetase